ncbi:MAG: hypothetical protein J5379_01565 [Clostridiales bacterium]|nr:hypothetical protein [Clostridiales bacterium]
MSLFKSLKNKIEKEKETFSKLDAKQKRSYFIDYYLLKILIIIALIVAVVWFAKDAFANAKTIYTGCSVGVDVSEQGTKYLTDDFLQSIGIDTKKKKAQFGGDVLLVPQTSDNVDDMTIEMAFVSQVNADMYQYVLITPEQFEHFTQYDFYLDITDISEEEKYASLEFVKDSFGHMAAIKLPDSVIDKLETSQEEVYLCFVYSKDPSELNLKFIDYIFGF